jgi:hypothetical protein
MKASTRLPATAALLVFALAAAAARGGDAPLPAPDPDGWIALFNGKDLAGWDGDPAVWRAENGYLSGKADKVAANTFLVCKRPFADFVLEAKCMLIKGGSFTKSAVQYRSRLVDPAKWVVGGYQAALGEAWWGACYEERGRGVLWGPTPEAKQAAKPYDAWNQIVIEARGPLIRQSLNGVPCGELRDTDEAKRSLSGIVALQYHAPGGFEVRFRDIRIKETQ